MIEFSRRTRRVGEDKVSTWRRWLTQVQPYQNIIFFVLLIISLAILLMLWRGYRVRDRTKKAWETLNKVNSVQDLRIMEEKYGTTEVRPFIRYRLANAYYREGQYEAAKKEYERFLEEHPEHFFRARVEPRLKETRANIKWQSEDEEKKRLAELKELRNFPLVTIKTKHGEFQVELYEDDAPNTVANFINLAEKGAYNQTPFYEITPDLGLCLGTKEEDSPTYTLPFETNSLKNVVGTVGMIRALDPAAQGDKPERAAPPRRGEPRSREREEFLNSASSRFYISLHPESIRGAIDGKYTVFGRVSQGMDVVRKLKKGDEITEMVIDRKRNHPYEPQVIEMK